MTIIEEAIEGLPKGITCFLLEIGTKKAETTHIIGDMLHEMRPLSILVSFDPYFAPTPQFEENIKKIHGLWLDSNVILYDMSPAQFLKANSTKFHIIFAHNGIDAIPFKKFLVDGGKVIVV